MGGIKATYLVETDDPKGALTAITRGQSVGNPSILTQYETRAFLDKWCAKGKIEHESKENLYTFVVEWPQANFGTEGVNYLLSVVMGGQCDIDLIRGCRLIDLDLGQHARHWLTPRYGMAGLRRELQVYGRALVGGIVKPKIGLKPHELADVVQQMAEGGCDFIKEDEILADQYWCPMEQRLPLIAKVLQGYKTLYACCVTGDGSEVWKKARRARELGATAIHLNLWCGLGTYRDVRTHVQLPLFFQKSGDKVWTTGPYSIDYSVICQLVNLVGCDFANVGMYGGYLAESVEVLQRRIRKLGTTLPSFSCGMNPSLAEQIVKLFRNDVMVTSGGFIHGQAEGIAASVRALRRAVETRSPLQVS